MLLGNSPNRERDIGGHLLLSGVSYSYFGEFFGQSSKHAMLVVSWVIEESYSLFLFLNFYSFFLIIGFLVFVKHGLQTSIRATYTVVE